MVALGTAAALLLLCMILVAYVLAIWGRELITALIIAAVVAGMPLEIIQRRLARLARLSGFIFGRRI